MRRLPATDRRWFVAVFALLQPPLLLPAQAVLLEQDVCVILQHVLGVLRSTAAKQPRAPAGWAWLARARPASDDHVSDRDAGSHTAAAL